MFWYDGGIRPRTPEELEEEGRELPAEGMMLVGDKGKILAGFSCDNPRIIPERKFREYFDAKGVKPPQPRERDRSQRRAPVWLNSFQGGAPTPGNFLLAGPISEAFNLGAISLRLGGKRLFWDSAQGKITNDSDANKYLTREYRKGWELG